MRQVDIDWNIALFKAAREGDNKAASSAIDNGADVKAKEIGTSRTITSIIAKDDDWSNPETKLSWPKEVTEQENFEYNYTPLHWAVYKAHETETSNYQAVAQLLIDNGAHVNAQDHMGQTPLHWAIRAENYDLVKLLIDNGANVNAQDHMGQTPLHWAIKAGDYNATKLLIENGANAKIQDRMGQAPLDYAMRDLRKAIENIKMHKYDTVYEDILACKPLLISMLIQNGADKIHEDTLTFLNAEDMHGNTYLDNALIQTANKDEDITFFIKLPIKLGCKFGNPQYGLRYAASHGLADLATHLLDNYEIDIDKEDDEGLTALDYAIRNNHLEIAELLRERDADAAIYSLDALCQTAKSGFKEAVEYILVNYTDFDINKKDYDGLTALDYAIYNGKFHTALLLVKNGASVCTNENKDLFDQFYSSYIHSMRIGALASLTGAGLLYAISNDYRYNLAATAVFGVISAYSSTSVKSKTYTTAFAYSASSALYMLASESEELAMVCTISSAALAFGTFCYSMYTCSRDTIQLNAQDLSSM